MSKTPGVFKTKDFLKMKAVWDRKLKESGLKDVEVGGLRGSLAQEGWSRWPPTKGMRAEADTLRHQFLYNYKFKSLRDRKIWQLYTEGGGRVENTSYKRHQIYYTMVRLKKEFKEWFRAECEAECERESELDGAAAYHEIIRELEEEDGHRKYLGGTAMRGRGEVWVEGSGWRTTRGNSV